MCYDKFFIILLKIFRGIYLYTNMYKMDDKKILKNPKEYSCNICNYNTLYKKDYNKHLLTAKHIRITNYKENILIVPSKKFICNCGKEYKNRQGLFKHKKLCSYKPENIIQENPFINTNFIIDIIKENQEFKKLLLEQNNQVIDLYKENNILNKENNILINKLVKKESNTTINNNTTNNNQKFNLNFFLNDTCKDAMNIKEFIENIKITFEELLTIGDTGFVNGVSDIFIKRLQDLDITKRPIHCTDVKRDTIYLKNEDTWNKDDKDNTNLKDIIKKVEYKNVAALYNWILENPESKVNDSSENLLKDKIYLQTLQGDDNTRDKIIKNISKEVVIDKQII